ncbi:hypothetical protein ABID08_004445 [Rhizobium binae]|uniref:Uncharacterized protein n=1 Tax=Rhizobium binae TaxID=1138190 RepID=A0ABV2MKT4_9HYPH|nr:hypothetical protein [Rhizobium leguminosarum bv. viciae]
MNNSFLREPQVELFCQAYFVGLTLGHLPFFFRELGGKRCAAHTCGRPLTSRISAPALFM